jgi:hypothetical protein
MRASRVPVRTTERTSRRPPARPASRPERARVVRVSRRASRPDESRPGLGEPGAVADRVQAAHLADTYRAGHAVWRVEEPRRRVWLPAEDCAVPGRRRRGRAFGEGGAGRGRTGRVDATRVRPRSDQARVTQHWDRRGGYLLRRRSRCWQPAEPQVDPLGAAARDSSNARPARASEWVAVPLQLADGTRAIAMEDQP